MALGISKRRFIDHLDREPRLRKIVEEGREYGRASIRRAQFKLLNDGNATMAIWLGKQYLGQRDRVDNQLPPASGGPIEITLAELLAQIKVERERMATKKLIETSVP